MKISRKIKTTMISLKALVNNIFIIFPISFLNIEYTIVKIVKDIIENKDTFFLYTLLQYNIIKLIISNIIFVVNIPPLPLPNK